MNSVKSPVRRAELCHHTEDYTAELIRALMDAAVDSNLAIYENLLCTTIKWLAFLYNKAKQPKGGQSKTLMNEIY